MANNNESDASRETLGQLVNDAGTRFVLIAFGLPIVAAVVAVGIRDGEFLNFVHVIAGTVWAGAAVFLTGVLAPTLNKLDQETQGKVSIALIPKGVVLFSGVAFTTLLTGPVLAIQFNLWDLNNPYLLGGIGIGIVLLGLAVYLIALQLQVFREVNTGGPPDQARIGRIAGRIRRVGPVILGFQLAAVIVMALLRTGGL